MVFRFPVVALRLCCNSAPSTSFLSPATLVLSLRHSHVIASSTPQLARHFGASLVWIRRGGKKDWEEAEEVKGARTKHTDESSSSSDSNGGQEPIKPMEPTPPRRSNKIIIFALLSFTLTLLLAQSTVADKAIPADAPHVDFDTFAKKYLRAGEIQKIAFVVGKEKAVATLFPGAIIDGKPAPSDHIVINYPHPGQQFWADVRKEEREMGIGLGQGVEIQALRSPWRNLAFGIGCFLIVWLCIQYIRFVRSFKFLMRTMTEESAKRAKQGMKK